MIVQVRSPRWSEVPSGVMDPGFALVFRSRDGLRVIITAAREPDERVWLHVSASKVDRAPTWGELVDIKEAFIGAEKTAIQVLAKRSEWVNIAEHALHLWHCTHGDALPDFRVAGVGI